MRYLSLLTLAVILIACGGSSDDDSDLSSNVSVCQQDAECMSNNCDPEIGACMQSCQSADECGDQETCIALGDDPEAKSCWPTCSGSDISNCTSRNPALTQCVDGRCADEG